MAKIGKHVIDSLTRSMYEDSRCIFREYIQNAADQIDIAKEQHLEDNDYYEIHVRIFRSQNRIEIEDTATGVSASQRDTLKDVASSQKQRGKRKGFRGIGRLGGLGYCKTLTFETSFKGENVKTLMHWDADKMNKIVDDELDDSEAGNVIDDCTSFENQPEAVDKHYFKVIMEDVTDERLLDVENIRDYLSMISPVDYPTQFSVFASQIKRFAQENGITLDTYNIYVGDENGEEQIYKGYTTKIKDTRNIKEKERNGEYDIKAIKFLKRCDDDGNIIYWGWYSISELPGQIPSSNYAYGIRLRCKNIQLGDESTTKIFFVAEGDKRFAQWFYGELFVETPLLVPDARRDYLRECEYRATFERMVRDDFTVLKDLCNEASSVRGILRELQKANDGQKNIEKKREKGTFLSPKEKDDSDQKFLQFKENKEKALKKFERKKAEMKQKDSPLTFIYDSIDTEQSGNTTINPIQTNNMGGESVYPAMVSDVPVASELRTDKEIYNKFGQKEKEVINAVYNAIYNAIADEDMREGLIKKIEKELTK